MIEFTLPIKAVSVANLREHWRVARRRTQSHRNAARLACPRPETMLVVSLLRIGVRRLDDDNLRSALKAARDGVASKLGVDDASPLVRWEYAQATCREAGGGPRVVVRIQPLAVVENPG